MLVHGVDISTLEGWMVKINSNPSMFGKSMNRRWFRVALVPTGSEQKLVLSYAKTKTAKEPRGWLYLEDVTGVYCRRDMIEVVSPMRTLRFKGETSAEHRLWSDSLHTLCNPPKASSKHSIEEKTRRTAERKTEDAKALARLREQDRDRIADPKRSKEHVVDAAQREANTKTPPLASASMASTERPGAAECKVSRDKQPEADSSARSRPVQQQQQQPVARGQRADSPGHRESARPQRRRSNSDGSRSSGSDSDHYDRRGRRTPPPRASREQDSGADGDSGDDDQDDVDERCLRAAPAPRQALKTDKAIEQREPPVSARSRRQLSDDDHDDRDDRGIRPSQRDASPPTSTRQRQVGRDDGEEQNDARAKRATRQPSVSEHSNGDDKDSEDDNDGNDDDSSDDDDRDDHESRQRQTPRSVTTEIRPSLLVSQIKAASPCVTDPKPAASQQRSVASVPPVAVSSATSKRNGSRTAAAGSRYDDSSDEDDDEDEDPEEESPREATPRGAAGASTSEPQQRHERVDSEGESKPSADEHRGAVSSQPLLSAASAAAAAAAPMQKTKKQAEYFDDDDDEEEEEEEEETAPSRSKSAPSATAAARGSDNQAVPATHEPRREERLKSGGTSTIARDNNFVEDDWDAEDDHDAPSASQAVSSPVNKQHQATPGFGGVAADANFASEEWDD